jgi:hypothetical protein
VLVVLCIKKEHFFESNKKGEGEERKKYIFAGIIITLSVKMTGRKLTLT